MRTSAFKLRHTLSPPQSITFFSPPPLSPPSRIHTGANYLLPGIQGNDITRTNVPDVRVSMGRGGGVLELRKTERDIGCLCVSVCVYVSASVSWLFTCVLVSACGCVFCARLCQPCIHNPGDPPPPLTHPTPPPSSVFRFTSGTRHCKKSGRSWQTVPTRTTWVHHCFSKVLCTVSSI